MPTEGSLKDEFTLGEIFGPAGIFSQHLPNYEYRPSQLAMARAVRGAIQSQNHLCVESETGTGKTLAYLIPALFSRKRVVVSTATKNLQDQIFFKDVPLIRQYILPELSATYMKGRQNYLCLHKLHEGLQQETVLTDVQQKLRRVSDWVKETLTGDRSELVWMEDFDSVWGHIDARSDTCTGRKCPSFDDCYITKVRERVMEADLIVVNHSLFFSNLALESDEIGKILPEFPILILDEAHEVEDSAANCFGKQISNYKMEEFCRSFRRIFWDREEYAEKISCLELKSADFFNAIPVKEGKFSLNLHLSDVKMVDSGENLVQEQIELREELEALYHFLMKQRGLPVEAYPLTRQLEQLISILRELFNHEDSNSVYWFERRGRGVFLNTSPIDVDNILREKLFSRTDSTVLTAATLTTNNNFEYLKGRLGVDKPTEVILDGEFDYSEQSILYIPRAFPEPRSPNYLSRALVEIEEILEITKGDAFLLFTSIAQMNRVCEELRDRIRFPVFCQGERPKTILLEIFKETSHSVLCATNSFWQGVDVQGDALRAVIVDKLPFQVPTRPLVSARMRRLETKGDDPFLCYSLPEAIITLKQGLGRLIRSRQDRGILAILDSRLYTRHYGKFFLESVPNCPVTDDIRDLKKFFRSI